MSYLIEQPESSTRRSAIFQRGRQNRLELRCWWVNPPQRWAAWLMFNPSTADEQQDDPTTRRVTHFSKLWGYDGWIIVNLYPWISSKPREVIERAKWWPERQDWYSRDDLMFNEAHIGQIGRQAAIRIAAFGAIGLGIEDLWVDNCVESFMLPSDTPGDPYSLYCLGKTKYGRPVHPMARGKYRVPDNQQPVLWKAW